MVISIFTSNLFNQNLNTVDKKIAICMTQKKLIKQIIQKEKVITICKIRGTIIKQVKNEIKNVRNALK